MDHQAMIQRLALSDIVQKGYTFETPSRKEYAYGVAKLIEAPEGKFVIRGKKYTPKLSDRETATENMIDGFNASRTEESARATAVWYNENNADYPSETFVIVSFFD